MQQALWRGWLMVEGIVWRYVLYVKCIQSSRSSPKNRNRVPDVHHERLTQQSHVVTSGAEVTRVHLTYSLRQLRVGILPPYALNPYNRLRNVL